jgi:uncharacterized protein RhaS with RHS repeats
VNRSYSSGQGRFTSVDPIGFGASSLGSPQSLNLYAYVENNPIDFVDPSGLNASSTFFVCYDLTTYYYSTDGLSYRTESTTICHFFGGGGGTGGVKVHK